MLKKLIFISSLLLSTSIVYAATPVVESLVRGNGNLKKENRILNDFNQIKVNGNMTIIINCQNKKKFDIEGDANILPMLRTSVVAKVLNITVDKKYKENLPLKISINNTDISKIEIQGSSKIIINKVKNNNIQLISLGNADFTAYGTTKNVSLDISGSGYIDTKNLKAEKASVNLKGASIVDVFASKDIDLKMSGFGKINYYGNPKNVKKTISGAGSINSKK